MSGSIPVPNILDMEGQFRSKIDKTGPDFMLLIQLLLEGVD